MPPAPIPTNETERLTAVRKLASLQLARRPVEMMLDIVREQLGVERALVSIVDETTQHPFLHEPEGCDSSPRSDAFCGYVVHNQAPVIVPDAVADPRFAENAFVSTGFIGFYYGYPIFTPEGHLAGALCVHGRGKREPQSQELKLLESFANMVTEQLRAATLSITAEREHRHIERRLVELVEHTPAAVAVFDENMQYIAVSRRFRQDYRLGDTPIIGRSHYDVFPEIAEPWKSYHQRCLAGETLSSSNASFERPDGTTDHIHWELIPWRHTDGTVGGVMMFNEVLTDQVHRNEVLKETANRLDLALRSAKSGLWDWDMATGTVNVTEAWWTMLGFESFELCFDVLIGWDLVHPEDRSELEEIFRRMIDGETNSYSHIYRLQTADGNYKWIAGHGYAAERDKDGRATRLVGLNMDYHQQQMMRLKSEEHTRDLEHAKSKLETQAAELIELNKAARVARKEAEDANAAKSRFLANMSHEIRTPMTAILGYLEMIETPDEEPQLRQDAVRTIRRNADHLLELINDVLDLSKLDAHGVKVEKTPCETASIISDSFNIVSPIAEHRGVELVQSIGSNVPPTILTDPVRVRQIIVNLLSNAIKFTSEGNISLRVSYSELEQLCVEVEDTGIGMSREQSEKIFAPFAQADTSSTRRQGGTGLGLTISRQLARLLGGDLVVARTEVEQGTLMRATVHAPLAERVQPPGERSLPGHPASESNAQPLRGLDILLAEDGVDNQRLLMFMLSRAGATVTLANDGLEAFERCTGRDRQTFDLILMDMQMPRMDGYKASQELRHHHLTTPIIALTANALDGDRSRCMDAGCDDYLSKPVDRQRLIAICARWAPPRHGRDQQAAA
ncbi:MAG: ATP-binding protein [Phycisphaerales bacterium]